MRERTPGPAGHLKDDEPKNWQELTGTGKRTIARYYCPRCKRDFLARVMYTTCPMTGCNELVFDITDIHGSDLVAFKKQVFISRFPKMEKVRIRNRKGKYD